MAAPKKPCNNCSGTGYVQVKYHIPQVIGTTTITHGYIECTKCKGGCDKKHNSSRN
jgi:RecJ-like exonuclease